jgi:hypothetical protein
MVEEGDRVVILGLRAPWNLMLSEELKQFLFWFSSDLAGCNTVDKENFGPIHGLGMNGGWPRLNSEKRLWVAHPCAFVFCKGGVFLLPYSETAQLVVAQLRKSRCGATRHEQR